MKEAIIVDLNGDMIDVTLVADNVTGVFPCYNSRDSQVQEVEGTEGSQESVSEAASYIIAIPVPVGLHKPKFDFTVWELYNKPLELGINSNDRPKTEGHEKMIYKPCAENLWVEGYQPEKMYGIGDRSIQPLREEKIETLATKLKRKQQRLVSICKRLWE
ncbi:hypothetical protein [Paenibacillus elgii]|uniref:hypothetical protein n=1 Tax=Paenibacillus elgii TaxID=189691 RepID=UPI000248C568|nr:hypothetical protein [Paenibacillus elgii]